MEYQKIKTLAYNLHVIKTDKFKSIKIRVNFKRKITKEDIINTALNLLRENGDSTVNARGIAK
jgi:hypothetical protein